MGQRFTLTPVRLTVLSFLVLILFGTILLMLPASTADFESASFVDAFFTATSAVCVTGLAVKDTATFFSFTGQIVILILIQLGGLGIMTLYASIPVIFGDQLKLSQRRMFSAIFDVDNYIGLKIMLKRIMIYTFTIEFAGAAILSFRFYRLFGEWGKAIHYGVFHSISAFCNAGFSLFSNSLESFTGDVVINLTIMVLYILGGIGFVVLYQILTKRSFRGLSANAKLAIVTTAILIVVPSFFVFHMEFDNAFAERSILEKTLATLMSVTTTRTAGFNSIPMGSFGNATIFLFCILMFIGASPGGTGGGTKTTTIGLMALSIRSIFKGKPEIECFGRRVPRDVVTKSVAIIAIAFSVITVSIILLMMTESADFVFVFFEAISAFNTVGLTLGLTPQLTIIGKFLICFMMFVGRIGTLSLILILSGDEKKPTFQWPEGRFMVG